MEDVVLSDEAREVLIFFLGRLINLIFYIGIIIFSVLVFSGVI